MATRDGGRALVGILMGSDSDWDTMEGAAERLKAFEIPYEANVMSAHRTPKDVAKYAQAARRRGIGVLIVGAGGAAHLAGAVAAWSTLPVIGVPVATVAIGRGGAENAAILAVQILSLKNRALRARLERFKVELAENTQGKNVRLQRKLSPEDQD